MGPLVTVVTATWGRPKTVMERAIPSVQAQTYQPIQHIIVTDGYDPALNDVLHDAGYDEKSQDRRLVQLGRNWSFCGDGSVAAPARAVGAYLAAGEYICYLDDDNEYLPNHVANLADALDRGADLAFCPWLDDDGVTRGGGVPRKGLVDTSSIMHKAWLLKHSTWALDGYDCDGKLVERWVQGNIGCKWVALDEPTMVLYQSRNGSPDAATGAAPT